MAKIWMQGKERFMCRVCENEEIEPGQKTARYAARHLSGRRKARMKRLTRKKDEAGLC